MEISAKGVKYLKIIVPAIVIVCVSVIILSILIDIKNDAIIVSKMFALIGSVWYIFLGVRLKRVFVFFEKKSLKVNEEIILFKDIISIKRHWMLITFPFRIVYKVKYYDGQNNVKYFIFLPSSIYFFCTPDYIHLLRKKIVKDKEKKYENFK